MPERKAILLRLPPDVFDALRRWADQEMRSANAQVEYVLRGALLKQGLLRPGREKGGAGRRSTPSSDEA